MDGDTSDRAFTKGYQWGCLILLSEREYLHALRICLLGHPYGSSIAARYHYVEQQRGEVGWDGMRVLEERRVVGEKVGRVERKTRTFDAITLRLEFGEHDRHDVRI